MAMASVMVQKSRNGSGPLDASSTRPVRAPGRIFDGDGVSDADEENIYHTNAALVDTDGDGLPDGFELGLAPD